MREYSSPELAALQQDVKDLVVARQGDLRQLLELLHCLEDAYIFIREGAYLEALPQTRNELYKTLREMAESDTRTTLPRPQIQMLLELFQRSEDTARVARLQELVDP